MLDAVPGPRIILSEVGIENPKFWDQKSEPKFCILDQKFCTWSQRSHQGWAKFPNSNFDLAGVKMLKFRPANPCTFVFYVLEDYCKGLNRI
jgi:hypothetical protein